MRCVEFLTHLHDNQSKVCMIKTSTIYEDLFKSNLTKRDRIDTKELLSTIKDDPYFKTSRKHIGETEKILAGNFV